MRVISGSAKGKQLKFPKSPDVRPTTDMAKEAMFSILGDISGMSALDLYAGSGSLGIEALSRGAKKTLFVEMRKEIAEIIKQNLKLTGFEKQGGVRQMKAEDFLNINKEKFDLIFFAPPWAQFSEEIVKKLDSLLSRNGIIILEYSKKTELPKRLDNLEIVDTRDYGDTRISFLRHSIISAEEEDEEINEETL